MKRKTISAIAAVLVLAMILGLTVFAASPSTGNTSVATDAGTYTYNGESVIPRGPGYQQAGEVRATSDYVGVTDNAMIATIYNNGANDPHLAYMKDYAKNLTGKKVLGPYKLRMYKAGVSIWDGFGTFNVTLGVGNGFEGQTATVYLLYKDGTVGTTTAVVSKGKITLSLTQMATILIEFK